MQHVPPLERELSVSENVKEEDQSHQPLLTGQVSSTSSAPQESNLSHVSTENVSDTSSNGSQQHSNRQAAHTDQQRVVHEESEESEHYLPDAIKLGLGDFIFYSVLVGRAAMYDMLTALVSYLAVMAGLGTTLLLLALHRKALPALPISIGLGIVFYLLARWLLEPFVLNLSTNLVFV